MEKGRTQDWRFWPNFDPSFPPEMPKIKKISSSAKKRAAIELSSHRSHRGFQTNFNLHSFAKYI